MKILYSWLKDFIAIKETPEKLAEQLSATSFETAVLKRIGKDAILDVKLLPNRVADAASHFGIAREIALLGGYKLTPKIKSPPATGTALKSKYSVSVSPNTGCRRYMLAAMNGIRVSDSPAWLKKRLVECGLRPINNVVDATNYVMLELGQPLHAFDADKIVGRQVFVRFAKKGERIETIEKKVYELCGSEVLIADKAGPLALAGLKGGSRAEISNTTKNILIEAANFDPILTRETSRRHALRTDASWRFENDLDPASAEIALKRVLALIAEIAEGEIMAGVLDYYPKKGLPRELRVSSERISRLIGQDLSASKILKIVSPFCRSVRKIGRDMLVLKIEPYRRDIKYFEDVAEEVARLLGYNAIPRVTPIATVIPARKNLEWEFRERLRDELVALGFSETYNYSFIASSDIKKAKIPEEICVELINPVSSEYQYLRPTLLPNLLKAAHANLRFFEEVKLFEIGKEYSSLPSKTPKEDWRLAGIITRRAQDAKEIFLEAKGALESLMERLGFDRDDYNWVAKDERYFIPGASGKILIARNEVGELGILSPEILRAYDIDAPTAYWVMNVELLEQTVSEEHEFEPLHKYPDVIRDISLLLPLYTKVDEVENVIEGAGAKYLEDVDLFDVYEGEGLPEDKTSMAFHLIFRAPDRTLTDEEVNTELKKILDALKAFGAEIR